MKDEFTFQPHLQQPTALDEMKKMHRETIHQLELLVELNLQMLELMKQKAKE